MSSTRSASRLVRTEPVMGTVVSFDVRDQAVEADVRAVEEAVTWLHQVDETFSTYRPNSVVSRLDRHEVEVRELGPDVRWIFARCEELRRHTAGYFDVRARGDLDPSALVKGWAVERAARLLVDAGIENFCITAGGDLVCRGVASDTAGWRVGVQHPLERDAVAAVVDVSGRAVATSGSYERGEHIRDPHSGRAPRGVLSVTMVGPDLGTADAYSTAAFAMGPHGPQWAAGLRPLGYETMTVLSDHSVLTTSGFPLAEVAR